MRAGAAALSLLAAPLNVHVLTSLSDEETPLANLSRAVGHPPPTTMRSYLKGLADWGLVDRQQEAGFPGTVAYSLTLPGERFLTVASALQEWLARAPDGPIVLSEPAATSAIKALVEGWNSKIVRVLASRPLALTELARLIPSLTYPTLERRVGSMRRSGQLRASRLHRTSRGTPYEATPWLRHAASPLFAAVSWEREWAVAQTKSLGRIDIEALFLLTIPLLDLPGGLSGRCRLAVEMGPGPQPEYGGATVNVQGGRIRGWSSRLGQDVDAWAEGTTASWFGWMGGWRSGPLDLGGDRKLAGATAEAFRQVLAPSRKTEAA